MPHEKISRSFALGLERLLAGEVLAFSAFGNKRLLARLVEDRAVVRMVTGRNRSSYCCSNTAALKKYLRLQFGITDLAAYLQLLDKKHCDGEDSLSATTSTKTLRCQSLQGFFIKAFSCKLNVSGRSLDDLPEGVEYFVRDPDLLMIPPDICVVGVENPECFVKAERLLHLFPQKKLVFVLRYHSNRLIHWLEEIENRYLHFGDFDPAGIAIYYNEFVCKLGEARCSFFVPHGIEQRIMESGDSRLYDQQVLQGSVLKMTNQVELQSLIDCIHRAGKGLEQEWLLLNAVNEEK